MASYPGLVTDVTNGYLSSIPFFPSFLTLYFCFCFSYSASLSFSLSLVPFCSLALPPSLLALGERSVGDRRTPVRLSGPVGSRRGVCMRLQAPPRKGRAQRRGRPKPGPVNALRARVSPRVRNSILRILLTLHFSENQPEI